MSRAFGETALEFLGATRTLDRISISPTIAVDLYTIPVVAWKGERSDHLTTDCRKRGSLLDNGTGSMSCLEVEVARRLRTHPRWGAGWVQGWVCGRATWSEWIWGTPPWHVRDRNERVQTFRGERATSYAGHPDVALTSGDEWFYIECKVLDSIEKQVEWIKAAVLANVIEAEDVVVLQGILR